MLLFEAAGTAEYADVRDEVMTSFKPRTTDVQIPLPIPPPEFDWTTCG